MEEKERRYIEEDEITLKELILKIKEFFWEVVRNWKWVVLIVIPFVTFFMYKAVSTPVTYEAELTFMVNEDDGGGMGGVSAILGQFGFGGGRGGKNNLDKILELAKSRHIVQQIMFDTISINGRSDIISNHIISFYDYHNKWEKDTTGLRQFLFTKNAGFSRTENKVIKILYKRIVGSSEVEALVSTGINKDTGIMTFSSTTVNEGLSIQLCNLIYDKLSTFYINTTIEKQQQTFDVMQQKVDSIKNAMKRTEYELANFRDSNAGLYTTKAKMREIQLQRDVRVLNEMYAVSLKNFEIADFSLKNKTPFIQVIDMPIEPLKIKEESVVKNLIIGGVLGGFFSIFFLMSRKVYRDTMSIGK